MKLKITFKSPDAVSDAIQQHIPYIGGDSDDPNFDGVQELEQQLAKWIKYGEYVTIGIDTIANTAVVLPVN